MKIVVMNYSGNVGKTSVVVNLLKPRLPAAAVVSVESINEGADASLENVTSMTGGKYLKLSAVLATNDDAIIDVGASNVEAFTKQLEKYAGAEDDFDLFIVPTVPERKAIADTVNTVSWLAEQGVPGTKIKVVFNKVEDREEVGETFASILALAKLGKCMTDDAGIIDYNEIHEHLGELGMTIDEIESDTTDWREKIRTGKTDDEKESAARRLAIKRLSKTAQKNLDAVFEWVMA